jgi:hypothetical protein
MGTILISTFDSQLPFCGVRQRYGRFYPATPFGFAAHLSQSAELLAALSIALRPDLCFLLPAFNFFIPPSGVKIPESRIRTPHCLQAEYIISLFTCSLLPREGLLRPCRADGDRERRRAVPCLLAFIARAAANRLRGNRTGGYRRPLYLARLGCGRPIGPCRRRVPSPVP